MELKSVNSKETNIYELLVSIDAETFAEARKKAYAKSRKDIAIPGFRKGKAPMKMIESRYGEAFFYEDALEICYPEAAEAAIKESELKFVAVNNVDVKKMDSDGVELLIEITVKPEVEITEYKLLKATQKKVEVTDEEVDERINQLRERNSRIEPVDRTVENGDIVTIDFDGSIDGVPFDGGKAEGYDLTIGSGNFIPGFEEQIISHAKDEEFDINVKFPDDYGAEELAGKDSVFKIKIQEIKVKILPEVDDDFAQEVSEFDTVDEFKKDVAESIKKEKTEENESEIRKQLLDKLADNLKAEIPAVMIENEIDNEMNDMNYRLSMQGLSLDMYLQYMGMEKSVYREQLRESAEKSVKIRLALEKIAELENIEVTEEDYEKLYKDYAEQYQMSIDEIKKAIPEETVKGDLLVEKAIKFVRDNAKITTSRKKKAAKAEESEAE